MGKKVEKWRLGDTKELANQIAEETRAGLNRASCSIHRGASKQVGEKVVILNGHDEPVCMVSITEEIVVAFKEVDERFAKAENFASLDEWREFNFAFFQKQDPSFSDETLVSCIYFKVVSKPDLNS